MTMEGVTDGLTILDATIEILGNKDREVQKAACGALLNYILAGNTAGVLFGCRMLVERKTCLVNLLNLLTTPYEQDLITLYRIASIFDALCRYVS